jgi:hypothetical protein
MTKGRVSNPFTGTVKLIDKKTRVVEVLGPEPMGSRRPTDRQLMFWARSGQAEYMRGPQRVGLCFQADGRTAKFILERSFEAEKLLDLLSKYPNAPARLARPYGLNGWVVEE